jgi:hypothetical protein
MLTEKIEKFIYQLRELTMGFYEKQNRDRNSNATARVEDETTKSTENGILPQKTVLQPGVYDVSELSHLPMTISLGNDTYLVLTDADKERISGYFENKGIYPSYFDLDVIFRDKNGKVVNNGVQEIRVKYEALKSEERKIIEYNMRYLRKMPVYVEIPLDFFETWEVRGESIIDYSEIILGIGRSQEVKISTREFRGGEVELIGTIDIKRSGKDTVTATLVGDIESKSDYKLLATIVLSDLNYSVYEGIKKEQRRSTIAYLYLEPLERRTFEAQFSTPAWETDDSFSVGMDAPEYREKLPAEYQDRII